MGDQPFEKPQPATAVHIGTFHAVVKYCKILIATDHSPDDVRDRIRQMWKEKADTYLKKDYMVIK